MENVESEKTRQQWTDYVAKKLAKDVSELEIVNDLTQNGFDHQQAQEFVRHVSTHELTAMSKAGKRAAPWQIIIGLALVIVGVTITILTFKVGVLFLWYGVIIAGIGFIARGIWKMRW